MADITNAALHDAYAADYDAQVQAYDCHIADVLFGLCYELVTPGQRLLDAGIGSGLSAELFARAGLEVSGMDFSPAMLGVCRAKGFAADLKEHDLTVAPWPYLSCRFEHVTCCGVFHFISDLETVFDEVARVLVRGGTFSFTTRVARASEVGGEKYGREVAGGFEIFSHARSYVATLLERHAFDRKKTQRCYVGDDLFAAWIAQLQ